MIIADENHPGGQPAMLIRRVAGDHVEERLLQPLGDGTAAAGADGNLVDAADGRDFGGGAGEEDFVGDVEQLAGQGLLDNREAQVAGDGEHAVAGDAGER